MIETKHTQSEQRDLPTELCVDVTSSCPLLYYLKNHLILSDVMFTAGEGRGPERGRTSEALAAQRLFPPLQVCFYFECLSVIFSKL